MSDRRPLDIPPALELSPNPLIALWQLTVSGLVTAAKGMWVTAYNALRRPRTTVAYPFEKLDVAPNWRGKHRILREADGSPMCIACGACERICPDRCITLVKTRVTVVQPDGTEKQVNRPETMVFDLARCMYCNLCAEVCPKDCLHLTADYAYSTGDVRQMKADLTELLRAEPLSAFELRAAPEDPTEGGES